MVSRLTPSIRLPTRAAGCPRRSRGAAGSAEREDTEAVVEVFAEGLVADGLEQVAVGGGDDPDVEA